MQATALLWPPIRTAYDWVYRIARALDPAGDSTGATVTRQVRAVLAEMQERQTEVGPLATAITHFRKVTTSYWPGLFHATTSAVCRARTMTWR